MVEENYKPTRHNYQKNTQLQENTDFSQISFKYTYIIYNILQDRPCVWSVCICVLVTQSCPSGCSPPGSSVHGILEARILQWTAISSSRGLPLSRVKPESPALQADPSLSEPQGKSQDRPFVKPKGASEFK